MEYEFYVYATQGGGKVKWENGNYVFVEKPNCPGYEVGDIMPIEWGVQGPINKPIRSKNSCFFLPNTGHQYRDGFCELCGESVDLS